MDIVHRRGEATVADIMAELPDPPTYSAVRSVLRILAQKGLGNVDFEVPIVADIPLNPRTRKFQLIVNQIPD